MNFVKENRDLILIVGLVVIVLVCFISFSYTIAFFAKSQSKGGIITLGELDFDIELTSQNSTNILPGDTVNVDIFINNAVENKTGLVPFYFRFKILNNNNDYNFFNLVLENDENFVQKDNFYYYKFKLKPNDKVKVLDAIVIDTSLTQENYEDINLKILVDAVQSEFGAYKEIFPDAPKEWLNFIENS